MSDEQEKPTPAPGPSPDKASAEKKPKAPKAKDATAAAPKAAKEASAPKAGKDDAARPEPAEGPAAAAVEGKAPAAPGDKAAVKDTLTDDLGAAKVRRAKGSKNITHGICHILATFNNTKVTFSDLQGNVISWSSSGKCNFRGSRKSTAYAAQVVTQEAGRAAMAHGLKDIIVKVRGPGLGRDSAIRALQTLGMAVGSITDVTPVPHNGCRPRKRRRV
jgi:small subunit ribosomal protein S11